MVAAAALCHADRPSLPGPLRTPACCPQRSSIPGIHAHGPRAVPEEGACHPPPPTMSRSPAGGTGMQGPGLGLEAGPLEVTHARCWLLPGGRRWMGCRQHGHLLAVLGKVNGRPAAVGDGCVVGGGLRGSRRCQLAVLPGPAGARFAVEKQLGAAWRPASRRLPPHCGKVFIQQFP